MVAYNKARFQHFCKYIICVGQDDADLLLEQQLSNLPVNSTTLNIFNSTSQLAIHHCSDSNNERNQILFRIPSALASVQWARVGHLTFSFWYPSNSPPLHCTKDPCFFPFMP